MNLRRLQYFVTLVEQGSFVRAAKVLHISQSALSHAIRLLEEEVGLTLLDRNKSGTKPTIVGAQLLRDARNVLREATTLKRNAQALAQTAGGDVRFGFAPLPATLWLADVLGALARDHPGIGAVASVGAVSEQMAQLEADAIEFFVGARHPLCDADELDVLPFAQLPMNFIVRAGHPLLQQAAVRAEDLSAYALACITTDIQVASDEKSAPWFQNREISVLCDDCQVLFELTANSDVIWLASGALVHKAPERLAVLPVEVEGVPASIELVIASHAGRSLSPAAELVIATARNLVGQF
ncbi:LysR family transcriptional regulator [Caenibius sp. WL]|uniref:LysR family transcriptional regulator n=1 Tax=Caenibius sp. WL TaxID=2872646 RepID=UPI001C996067|nr:LysR family transcriptional regulator [Caenibius sp. WL]QZP07849.1 LysR family transcriptional regulator [Caenibius sp. WL]